MIIPSKSCIFVHIPKVAGQSIEAALLSAASEDDGSPEEMGLRKRNRDEPGPERLVHLTGKEYPKLGFVSYAEYWAFFKFAFVRNPWDRTYSIYRHFGFEEYMSFEYFLEYVLKRALWKERYWFVRPQCDFVLDAHGEFCVDFVGRFERLDEDFRHVASVLGLETKTLPHLNRAGSQWRFRKLRALKRYPRVLGHWREMIRPRSSARIKQYSAEALALIEDLYGCDMERFAYDPEQFLADFHAQPIDGYNVDQGV